MRSTLPMFVIVGLVVALASLSACQTVECGPGTIDRGGECEPADLTVGTAQCGPNTELRGDQCVPKLPPTECDPDTTQPETGADGVIRCIGTGGGGCSAPLACPNPTGGNQTICGQIYNFADDKPFAADGATGAKCTPGATKGPCALQITVRSATPPSATLPTVERYLDDCGRYRVSDIDVGNVTLGLSLQFDDTASGNTVPTDVTVPTYVVIGKGAGTRTKNFDAWIVDKATSDGWKQGGPAISPMYGLYAAIFRSHACNAESECNGDRFATEAGVTFNVSPAAYFIDGPGHKTVAPNANATTSNGTALATLMDLPTSVTGSGGLGGSTDDCQWPLLLAGPSPGGVLFQVFRPIAKTGKTCTR